MTQEQLRSILSDNIKIRRKQLVLDDVTFWCYASGDSANGIVWFNDKYAFSIKGNIEQVQMIMIAKELK